MLVVVGGEGIGDEDGGAPHRAELGEGRGAGALDHHVGGAEGLGHVVDEGDHADVGDPELGVERRHRGLAIAARLVDDGELHALLHRELDGPGDVLVEGLRALAAAEDEDREGISFELIRDRAKALRSGTPDLRTMLGRRKRSASGKAT